MIELDAACRTGRPEPLSGHARRGRAQVGRSHRRRRRGRTRPQRKAPLAAGIHACAQPSPSASRATRARRPACAIYILHYRCTYIVWCCPCLWTLGRPVSQITVRTATAACSTTCMLLYVLCRERPAASRGPLDGRGSGQILRWVVRPASEVTGRNRRRWVRTYVRHSARLLTLLLSYYA